MLRINKFMPSIHSHKCTLRRPLMSNPRTYNRADVNMKVNAVTHIGKIKLWFYIAQNLRNLNRIYTCEITLNSKRNPITFHLPLSPFWRAQACAYLASGFALCRRHLAKLILVVVVVAVVAVVAVVMVVTCGARVCLQIRRCRTPHTALFFLFSHLINTLMNASTTAATR